MKRALSMLLALFVLFSICITPVLATDTITENFSPVAEDVSVSAYAAIVLDMETGKVLYEHDADEKNYPASCTKIMTCYLGLKYGNVDDMITVSSTAFDDLTPQASRWNFKIGEEFSFLHLLKCVLVVSASEGANIIAEYISGSVDEFVELMNEEAALLGLENTHFVNCHGLPRSEHYTTARDLATIAMAAMEYPEFREIVGSSVTNLDPTNYHGATSITSTNGLLPGSTEYGGRYNYPHAIGIKTGHTSVAGYNLVSAANKDGIEILTVVMGCGSRESSFSQTVKLFDWTYDNYDVLTWGWEHEASEEAPEVPEAPEYEEIESSVVEEEVVIPEPESEPVAETAPEAPAEEAEAPVEAPNSAVEEIPSAAEPVVSPADGNTFSFGGISSSMMPVIMAFGVAILLLIILIIILVIVLVRRRR